MRACVHHRRTTERKQTDYTYSVMMRERPVVCRGRDLLASQNWPSYCIHPKINLKVRNTIRARGPGASLILRPGDAPQQPSGARKRVSVWLALDRVTGLGNCRRTVSCSPQVDTAVYSKHWHPWRPEDPHHRRRDFMM